MKLVGGAGFKKSLAVEFDTYTDIGVDDTIPNCTAPHLTVHSMGAAPNSAMEDAGNFARQCANKINDPFDELAKVHNITITYTRPVLRVYYDQIKLPVLEMSYDIVGAMQLAGSLAWIGFTASTGPQGGVQHSILGMYYEYLSSLAPSNSLAVGFTPTEAGALGTFEIISVDEYGHVYPFGGFPVNVTFADAAGNQQSFSADAGPGGNYTIGFNCTTTASKSVNVTLNGIPISGAPFAIKIVAGPVDASLGSFGGANTYARAGVPATVQFLVFDRFGNPTNANCSFSGSTLANNVTSINLGPGTLTGTGAWSFTFENKRKKLCFAFFDCFF
jgi:hypothetical protein